MTYSRRYKYKYKYNYNRTILFIPLVFLVGVVLSCWQVKRALLVLSPPSIFPENVAEHHDGPLTAISTTTTTTTTRPTTGTGSTISTTRTSTNNDAFFFTRHWPWFQDVLQSSHFVELDHCHFHSFLEEEEEEDGGDDGDLFFHNFMTWATPILDRAALRAVASSTSSTTTNTNTTTAAAAAAATQQQQRWRNEWTLELLEMYAVHSGVCDFEKKNKTKKHQQDATSTQNRAVGPAMSPLQRVVQTVPTPPGHARIVFVIVAYQDVTHLQRLIRAIHMPHHLVVIHLEESARGSEFEKQVHAMIASSSFDDNVVVRCFGSILYKTDSISQINLQLMDWIVNDLELKYDYHVTLGGAVYPLWGASELARHLYESGGHVWMGELTHKGMRVHHPQWGVFWKKRFMTSSSSSSSSSSGAEKLSVKAGFIMGSNQSQIPEWIDQALQHKATSGNQAVYSYAVVQALLQNPRVQHLHALAKYGCCCCVEERSWIGAMDVLGYLDEAKQRRSMFQLWGGDPPGQCRGSMSNAILDLEEDRCFRTEDPSRDDLYVWGNETWPELVRAKRDHGVLFARKFRSDHPGSLALLEKIRDELHEHGGERLS